MSTQGTIPVGKPDVDPSAPSHVQGVREGNARGGYDSQAGLLPDGKATAARSTGINPDSRNPIDPNAPTLTPA